MMEQLQTFLLNHPLMSLGVLYQSASAVLLACVVFMMIRRLYHKRLFTLSTFVQWLFLTLKRPLMALPWISLGLFLFHLSAEHLEEGWLEWRDGIEQLALIAMPAWIAWEISLQIKSLLPLLDDNWSNNISPSVVARTLQLIISVSVLLNFIGILGYSLSTLLAFGGIGGIVLGLAAKDWLANFFGGLMLMLDRPFSEGDWIRSPDRDIEGHVEQLGWRLTKIRTFNRRPIYVPNSLFTGIVVENATRMRNRRTVENFYIRYEDIDKVPAILQQIEQKMVTLPDTNSKEPHYAVVLRYDESAIICQVRIHINRIDRVGFLKTQEQVLLIIAEAIRTHGASFAHPIRRVFSEPPIGF